MHLISTHQFYYVIMAPANPGKALNQMDIGKIVRLNLESDQPEILSSNDRNFRSHTLSAEKVNQMTLGGFFVQNGGGRQFVYLLNYWVGFTSA